MRRFLRIALVVLAFLVIAPIATFACYDLIAFQSHRSEITALVAGASTDERTPPAELLSLIRTSSGDHLDSSAARCLLVKLGVYTHGHSQLGWQSTWVLWSMLAAAHLSERDEVTILLSQSYLGCGHLGYSSEAQARFGRPLSRLSTIELATLVALARSPNATEADLDEIRDKLLSRSVNGA